MGSQLAQTRTTSSNTDWKASGFLNAYLPAVDDSKYKLGFLALKDAVENQKLLRLYLEENSANIAVFVSKLSVDYQSPRRKGNAQIKLVSESVVIATDAKTSGYLNFHLPAEGGGQAKLGFIELKADNKQHAALMVWLEADPKNILELLKSLSFDYQPAAPKARPKFSLA